MGTLKYVGVEFSSSAVSIQLISPASGDLDNLMQEIDTSKLVSIQLISPASGDPRHDVWPQFCS